MGTNLNPAKKNNHDIQTTLAAGSWPALLKEVTVKTGSTREIRIIPRRLDCLRGRGLRRTLLRRQPLLGLGRDRRPPNSGWVRRADGPGRRQPICDADLGDRGRQGRWRHSSALFGTTMGSDRIPTLAGGRLRRCVGDSGPLRRRPGDLGSAGRAGRDSTCRSGGLGSPALAPGAVGLLVPALGPTPRDGHLVFSLQHSC